jgi:pSer/pThr/pTyr-binding forkhead associated (FHA) protein/two-component sensor histidine kinase
VPYLSWFQGELLQRHALEKDCRLGRDPEACDLAFPGEPSLSRHHAAITRIGEAWWIKDLGSKNGTLLNGLPLSTPSGNSLADGDEIHLGDLRVQFTLGFPGLDPERFIERVGDLFSEVRPEPSQALILVRGLEMLHRSTEALLMESSSSALIQSLLHEALKLLSAERGFVVMVGNDGTWQTVHRVGDVEDQIGLSHSVLRYAIDHRTAVLSNAPMADPRFGGESLVELHRGALICAPMEIEGDVKGLLYLDRIHEGRPFTRFDLALVQAFVRHGTVAQRHAQLAQKALGQAEMQGELLRLRSLNERIMNRTGEILSAMESSLRWLQSYGEKAHGETSDALRHLVARLQYLVESAVHETLLETPRENAYSSNLETLQAALEPSWQGLVKIRGAELKLEPVPAGTIWMAGNLAAQAVSGIVEPMLLRITESQVVHGRWQEEGGNWVLRLTFPTGGHGPAPDPWTLHSLQKTGIVWRWFEQTLSITFPKGIDTVPDQAPLPLLGLATEEMELMGLFQSVAEAGQLAIFPLEEDPPLPPLPSFRYLVIDALGVKDPAKCIQAYRRHPNFATVPILVVRAPEDLFSTLLAAGATDWLPEGFRWETLHHRLQVLKGHDELQRKALAAERLDSFRQMAGSLKHEINNPLAIMSMQVELLQRKYPEEPKLGKIAEMVERIRGLMQVLQKMREASVEDYPDGSSILKLS